MASTWPDDATAAAAAVRCRAAPTEIDESSGGGHYILRDAPHGTAARRSIAS